METAEVVQFSLLVRTDLDHIYCQCARTLIFTFESSFHCILLYIIGSL